jgi:pimeloyl-ACP methyl ester carboxylesterase
MRRRTGLALGVAAIGTILAATMVQAQHATSAPLPSITRLVTVGGRRVAFHVVSGSSPAVLFIAGNGEDGSSWDPVVGPIHRQTGAELITVDRAGFGGSDEDVRPTRIENEVADLEAGLSALGVKGRIVVVAHSYGGEVATSFVNKKPSRIAGAVLVDASIPSFFTDDAIARMKAMLPPSMPTENKEERTQAALFKAYPQMLHEFHAMQWPTSVPTTVVVAEHPPLPTSAENNKWIEEHRKFAQAAPNRDFVLAQGSGHIVMNDRPDIVVNAVVRDVEKARQNR